jgi:hypothetical protein
MVLFFVILLITICVIAALILDGLFFKKFNRLWRIASISAVISCSMILIFAIGMIFYGITWREFLVFMLMLFVVDIFFIVATYSLSPSDSRIRELREKYAKLYNNPRKEKAHKK